MLVIGERINGMFKDVRKAIGQKDAKVIQELARKQVEQGARALDVNVGPASDDPVTAMKWLVEVIQDVTDVTLCIDSPNPDAIRAGLGACKREAIINSTTAQKKKLDVLLPLAAEKNTPLIALTIDDDGVPANADKRTEVAAKLVTEAMEKGYPPEKLYIDPVILPCNVAQAQFKDLLESIKSVKLLCDPAPMTVIGLSNVSQGTKNRPLINRTALVMAISSGLDAAIIDPLDTDIMDAAITAELLLNKNIYCDSYLQAYRK